MRDDGHDHLGIVVQEPGPGSGSGSGSGFVDAAGRSRTESLGERVLGSLLDRAHLMPARLVGPLVAQEIAAVGGTDVSIWLQDYDQRTLQPLAGTGLVGVTTPIDGSWPGRAFTQDARIEQGLPDGSVRLYLPMLDGSDRVGVLAFTLPGVDDDDRRLAQRLAGLTADLIVTKSLYTGTFARVRAAAPLSLSAHLQWQTLPPLIMTTPDVALAGILEPAYDVGGDSFDYALDEHVLHLAVFDAMGHGLEAAIMATVVVAAYRHGRRSAASLPDLYVHMDDVLGSTHPGRFATAQVGRLDTETGTLSWVNAGHPAALRIRPSGAVDELTGPISRPVGFGGAAPSVQTTQLEPGDRVLFFTDGVVEERLADGMQFGEGRLRELVEQTSADRMSVAETVRLLSHTLMAARGGRTSDDASLLLVEWRGPPRDDELVRGIIGGLPAGDIDS
ncbi:PP2C family protein-serine/threonine phosphatase [Modestobacter sp. VKM Ac-2979]|uniref:PP2C family protein-serine/threonine phosphatase n=1 Tax=unclassified Modestobacter TaxID=2643866 RepID=UPI0022AB6029|nr:MULTISPECIES: PP2C family protein-serine/threonine phosphatase [unclassified Modestobacter]MCZ2811715.1 PP2C family protein-serine/threonine phosphatase [Modestobacter sp. VKM Ac-2979]MCZ2843438.1 PP2C family protein-serine/threonine phosphatase [Modestobacter sp. VKM Ac-2980]